MPKRRRSLDDPAVSRALTECLALLVAGATLGELLLLLTQRLEIGTRQARRLASHAVLVHRDRLRRSADPATAAALDKLRAAA